MTRCTWAPESPGYVVDCRRGTSWFLRSKGRPGFELHCPGCGDRLLRLTVVGDTQGRLA